VIYKDINTSLMKRMKISFLTVGETAMTNCSHSADEFFFGKKL